MRGRYRSDESGEKQAPAAPPFRSPAAAVAGGGAGAVAVDNPYEAPRNPVARATYSPSTSGSGLLASRGARLAACLIDGLAAIVLLLPAIAAAFFAGEDSTLSTMAIGLVAASGIAFIGFALYQLVMVVREGQSLGKRMMNIRIVNYDDGLVPSAGRLLGLRYIVNSFLGQFIPLYAFIDVMLIFGGERRCIHDYIAGTKVVEA
jgi:uncharacterized RDD family membrane protein YckC